MSARPAAAPVGLAEVAADLARAHLGAGRALRVPASGQSMWPLIRHGATVEVLPLGGAALAVGDVVLWARGGGLVLHRVVALTPDAVTTKGDAMAHVDPPVSRADVLGRLARRPWDRCVARLSRLGGAPLARAWAVARRAAP